MSSKLRAVKRIALGGMCLAMPLLAGGQNAFSPGGNDYLIAGALAGDQTFPNAAIKATGGYLVWQDNSPSTNGLRIRAARLNSSLAMSGAPFLVSTNATRAGDREKPQVSLLNGGGAVFVWQDGRVGFQRIYARFCATNGAFLTGEILVNTYTNNFQINPAVATLADGSVVVVWSSSGQDGSMQGIFAQRFSATGAKLGAEFQVNYFTPYNQRTPAVAGLANGNFVVVWISELQRASASVDVYARMFSAAGVAVGSEFAVNASKTNLCANPAVAGSPQGGFAVVWSQKSDVTQVSPNNTWIPAGSRSTDGWDVFGRLLDANGAAANAPIRLNTHTYGDQYAPRISAFGRNYLTVWVSLGQDESWEGVFGQFLNSGGGLEGVEFRVNTTTVSRQIHPMVAADGVNRFLVAWSSFVAGTSFDLFARAYDLIRVDAVAVAQGMRLSWNTQPGCVYQVQVTGDYVTWANHGSPRVAVGYSDSLDVSAANGMACYRVIRVVN